MLWKNHGMGNSHNQGKCFNVYETPITGRLDETTNEQMKSDVAVIRTYIRAEKLAAAAAPERKPPSIARTVLTSIWETPRIDFHRAEKTAFRKIKFRSKLLLIPWSAEAFEHAKSTNSVTGLVLEHVTPIDAMWQELKELDLDPDEADGLADDELWGMSATGYLFNHYMVAVLTKEQATAIDFIPTVRNTAFGTNPFLRYLYAQGKMDKARTPDNPLPAFSVDRFVLPGSPISPRR